ncbi:hypothetical protein SDC9_162527 [bioreactor metagenome]|uniref:Uncharacterized protein n=1 Tax=bioreactor metagenome TaxID=1076179 RepID=A0A645FLB3_9ZZZZ
MKITPQNPYTTEGMPANSCMAGLNMSLNLPGANSARKMLQQIAIGTPRIAAPSVTDTEPTIMGNIPNAPWLGAHFIPKIKLKIPTLAIIGTPFMIINTVISASTESVESAIKRKIRSDNLSFEFFISPPAPMKESDLHSLVFPVPPQRGYNQQTPLSDRSAR